MPNASIEPFPPAPPPQYGITRLAPSPTGALHLGNARTFLVNWALARRQGWRIVLRIEDLDGPRVKPEAIESCVRTLAWLGIDWDIGPLIQSEDLGPCEAAMGMLASRGLVYPCELSRSEIEAAASAPHDGADAGGLAGGSGSGPAGSENRFPPELRPADLGPRPFDDPTTNWRFLTPPGEVTFDDRCAGPQRQNPGRDVGDFVVWTRRGQPAYQLAVVVDDHRQGVTQVVRGDDLLGSAARQLLLMRALGLGPEPTYTHLPLVVGEDGRRLAKRHGDTRLATYRQTGVPAERVIGLLGRWCGVVPGRAAMSAEEFCEGFDLASMPRDRVTFTEEDDGWLRQGS
ncbi:MAG: glutamate--tRNA ligase family protein [Phycisphaerales bacterium JB054]